MYEFRTAASHCGVTASMSEYSARGQPPRASVQYSLPLRTVSSYTLPLLLACLNTTVLSRMNWVVPLAGLQVLENGDLAQAPAAGGAAGATVGEARGAGGGLGELLAPGDAMDGSGTHLSRENIYLHLGMRTVR